MILISLAFVFARSAISLSRWSRARLEKGTEIAEAKPKRVKMMQMNRVSKLSVTEFRLQHMAMRGSRQNRVVIKATSNQGEPEYRVRKTLPIFPLNVVALPATVVPLMIFEARYRVLFSTLLDGMAGIEEGLVQKDADWCGTKRFGMCFVDNEGRMATTGCTLEVEEFAPVPDGRLFIQNKGKERFKVIKVISEKVRDLALTTLTSSPFLTFLPLTSPSLTIFLGMPIAACHDL